jgi:hypothetical protein
MIKGQQTEKTLKILALIEAGKTNSEICKILGCNQVSISTVKARNNLPRESVRKHNWLAIQRFYNDGNSLADCERTFGLCIATIRKAQKRGEFQARSATEGARLRIKKHGGNKHSHATKEKMQKIIADKVANGTWHYSFSKVRTHEFISKFAGKVNLMGKWELEYAKYLDNNNIEWRRPKEKFYYEFDGLKSGSGYYTPDFFLVNEGVYIEIKGYETDKDRAKWDWFPQDQKHKVLKYKDLKELGLILSER